MTATHEIQPGRRIDLAREVVGLGAPDRLARLAEQQGGPPQRIDGFTVGAPELTGDSPHDGEMHPDGDCLVDLGAGDAVVVPKGVWHQVTMREPGRLIHITPGPNGNARLLGSSPR